MDSNNGPNGMTYVALDINDEEAKNNYKTKNESTTVSKRVIQIQREVIDLNELQLKYGSILQEDVPILNQISTSLAKHWRKFSIIKFLVSLFPIIEWMPKYSLKSDLLADTIAGFTVSILHIPQGIAYSLLAGLEPVNGLYVSFFPVIIYTFMGTSRHISIGTFAVASLMLSNTAAKIGSISSHQNHLLMNSTSNVTISAITGDWPPTTLEVLTTVCIVTGFVQMAMGFLSLGSLSLILSDHLVSSFSTAVAFHVATSQINHILGLTIPTQRSGPLKLIKTWIETLRVIEKTNIATLIVSLIQISVLVVFKEWIDPRVKKKFSFPIPIDLLVVIFSTLISWLLDIHSNFDVIVVGKIATGLPNPRIPRFDFIGDVFVDCVMIGIITFAVSLSLAKISAKTHNYNVYPNQELVALGTANVFSSFFLCYPASAALSRSTLQDKIGGKTQIAGIMSCLVLLLVLLLMAPLLYHLPTATLACVILVALKAMFMQLNDFKRLWRISQLDAIAWMITFWSVILLDVDSGLIVGICVAIFVILLRLVSPTSSVLGSLPSTEIYVDLKKYRNSKEINGIKIFRYSSAIFYLSRENFHKTLLKSLNFSDSFSEESKQKAEIRSLIIDMSCVPFMDSSGVDTLVDTIKLMDEHNISVYLTSCPAHILHILERTNFFKTAKKSCIYATIHDAVISLI